MIRSTVVMELVISWDTKLDHSRNFRLFDVHTLYSWKCPHALLEGFTAIHWDLYWLVWLSLICGFWLSHLM